MKTQQLNVATTWPSFVAGTCRHLVFWSIILTAIGISRVWFGGAFMIDLIAGVFAFSAVGLMAAGKTGYSARLTYDEVRSWVAAGMPEDVKSWKEGRTNGR